MIQFAIKNNNTRSIGQSPMCVKPPGAAIQVVEIPLTAMAAGE